MHRTHHLRNGRIYRVLLGTLAAAVLIGAAAAQEPIPLPASERPKGSIFVGMDTTKTVQMATKKKIKTGSIERPGIAQFERDPADATIARIKGTQVGLTYLELVDDADNKEIYQIIVEPDLEYIRNLVKTKVPGSNVEICAVGAGTVYVSGFVDSPENLVLILDLVQRGLGVQVINGMRVVGVQQVQLNVVVAEVSRGKLRQLSFAFQHSGNNSFLSSALGLSSNVASTATLAPGSVSATLTGAPNNLFLGMVNDAASFWAFCNALKNENLLKLLAEPKVIALSGRQAEFLDGGQQAIPVPSGLGQVGVQYMEFGVKLKFVPTVLGNGRVRLDVEPEVSDLNAGFGTTISGTTVPGESIERVHTTVEMEVGQTYVIGGLIHHTVNASNTEVPILGELPCIGVFFSGKQYQENEDELMVMVTPYFVDSLSCDQLPSHLPGQETRSPDDYELFLEGILEAPHGLRPVCLDGHYNAAWKMSPTASVFPCGPCGKCGKDGCRAGGCGGNCDGSSCGEAGCFSSPAATVTAMDVPPPPAPARADASNLAAPARFGVPATTAVRTETMPSVPTTPAKRDTEASPPVFLPRPEGDR